MRGATLAPTGARQPPSFSPLSFQNGESLQWNVAQLRRQSVLSLILRRLAERSEGKASKINDNTDWRSYHTHHKDIPQPQGKRKEEQNEK